MLFQGLVPMDSILLNSGTTQGSLLDQDCFHWVQGIIGNLWDKALQEGFIWEDIRDSLLYRIGYITYRSKLLIDEK